MHDHDTPKTVYLLWQGEYSDSRVVAVYTREEDAEAVKTLYNRGATYRHREFYVEEAEMDPPIEGNLPNVEKCYWFRFEPNGKIIETGDPRVPWWNVEWYEPTHPTIWPDEEINFIYNYHVMNVRVTFNEARESQERAYKIACDRVAQWLAEREGIA